MLPSKKPSLKVQKFVVAILVDDWADDSPALYGVITPLRTVPRLKLVTVLVVPDAPRDT